jgi:hypothetical protein
MVPIVIIITHGLAIQIRMPYLLIVMIIDMDARLPESHIALNCQKEQIDQDGNATVAISLAVAL